MSSSSPTSDQNRPSSPLWTGDVTGRWTLPAGTPLPAGSTTRKSRRIGVLL